MSGLQQIEESVHSLQENLRNRKAEFERLSAVTSRSNEENATLKARLASMSTANEREKALLESSLNSVIHNSRSHLADQKDKFNALQSQLGGQLRQYHEKVQVQQKQIKTLQQTVQALERRGEGADKTEAEVRPTAEEELAAPKKHAPLFSALASLATDASANGRRGPELQLISRRGQNLGLSGGDSPNPPPPRAARSHMCSLSRVLASSCARSLVCSLPRVLAPDADNRQQQPHSFVLPLSFLLVSLAPLTLPSPAQVEEMYQVLEMWQAQATKATSEMKKTSADLKSLKEQHTSTVHDLESTRSQNTHALDALERASKELGDLKQLQQVSLPPPIALSRASAEKS
jgi:septal ring factor EnvC (AmiA/AmiB activator)